jgi:hypothetical protein
MNRPPSRLILLFGGREPRLRGQRVNPVFERQKPHEGPQSRAARPSPRWSGRRGRAADGRPRTDSEPAGPLATGSVEPAGRDGPRGRSVRAGRSRRQRGRRARTAAMPAEARRECPVRAGAETLRVGSSGPGQHPGGERSPWKERPMVAWQRAAVGTDPTAEQRLEVEGQRTAWSQDRPGSEARRRGGKGRGDAARLLAGGLLRGV